MKISNLFNRKIKFREKDYVERNYIQEDGKAVIPIEINSVDELYMKHDLKKLVLSDSITDYIEEIASIIPIRCDIILRFYCPKLEEAEEERIKKIIKNNYGMEIDDIDYEMKMSKYSSIALFILGICLLILAYNIPDIFFSLVKEFILIAGWVALWEMLESIILTNNKRKFDRLNKLQLYDSQVEFIYKES